MKKWRKQELLPCCFVTLLIWSDDLSAARRDFSLSLKSKIQNLDIRFQCPIGPKNRISTSLVFKSVF